jgi:hypothetical protein
MEFTILVVAFLVYFDMNLDFFTDAVLETRNVKFGDVLAQP